MNRRLIGGRWVRWDAERAADAYARGLWVKSTLADTLREVAQHTPQRVALIDGECRLDCQTLYDQVTTLAQVLLARMPAMWSRSCCPTGMKPPLSTWRQRRAAWW